MAVRTLICLPGSGEGSEIGGVDSNEAVVLLAPILPDYYRGAHPVKPLV